MLARSIYSKTQFHCRTNGILDAAVSHVPGIRIESVDRISNLGRGNINPFVVVVFFLPKLGLRLPQKSFSFPPVSSAVCPGGSVFSLYRPSFGSVSQFLFPKGNAVKIRIRILLAFLARRFFAFDPTAMLLLSKQI